MEKNGNDSRRPAKSCSRSTRQASPPALIRCEKAWHTKCLPLLVERPTKNSSYRVPCNLPRPAIHRSQCPRNHPRGQQPNFKAFLDQVLDDVVGKASPDIIQAGHDIWLAMATIHRSLERPSHRLQWHIQSLGNRKARHRSGYSENPCCTTTPRPYLTHPIPFLRS